MQMELARIRLAARRERMAAKSGEEEQEESVDGKPLFYSCY